MSMRYPAGFISAFYNPLKNPDAPTIGTATYGNASASVTFTAPANVGGSAITSFTAVSTPSGITGTGASSPITVSGLTNGTAYTFTVFATNSYGPSVFSAASNSVTPSSVPPIGSAYGGGYFAGQISTAGNGIADYNLVIGPKPSAQDNTWFLRPLGVGPGLNSVIDGPANSASMNSGGYAAAIFCEAVNVGGYTDWYMPAQNELEVCYYNLKPNTTANNTAGGANVNAVPSRASNYTSGTPSQTSATDFQTGGTQAFTALGYWSSTTDPISLTEGRAQIFTNGNQYATGKTAYNFVRAVRRVAV
jgi:hypothetical protein